MTTYLLYENALRSPEMRHEVGEPVLDDVIFIEHDGRRIVAGSMLERAMFTKREDVVDEFWDLHELGADDLVADQSFAEARIGPELVLRALRKTGASAAVVPPAFRVAVADYLRDNGVEVEVDAGAWSLRRRRKSPPELEGVARAQRAADTAMLTAARMLREAEPTAGGQLRFEGEVLTAELIREAMIAQLTASGAECEGIIVQSGDAWTKGHEIGAGPILPGASCIIDCFPKDRKSGAHADMSRTFVPGTPSDEVRKLHADCRAALDLAFETIAPGADDAYRKTAEYFDARGYPTQLTHARDGALSEGFFHALGHGVGLEVHEKPWIGRRADALLERDVIAIEPGLYFRGVGGVRLEDTVLVTDRGVEHFTDAFSYDLEP